MVGSRRETVAVGFLTIVGACIRFWGFGGLGLSHFDEGIYAAAGLWLYSPGGLADLAPSSIAYAPPGYPILVGFAYFLGGGPSDLAAIAVSLLAGIATIPVAAWLGRRTFGPGAGVATAALAALSGPHIAFSRMALTDPMFLLAWLTALGLGMRFLERPSGGRALAVGLAVGLTQLIKYNGWLAGVVIVFAAWPAFRAPRRDRFLVLGFGALAAGVACLSYLPWFRYVEGHGGYAGLLAHQRSYTGGLNDWVPHLRSQLAQGVALSGGISWVISAWLLAVLGSGICAGGLGDWTRVARRRRLAWVVVVTMWVGGLLILGSIPWLLAVFAASFLFQAAEPGRRVVGGWILLLSALTPLYHPYARLWLPLHAATWIVSGGLLAMGWARATGAGGDSVFRLSLRAAIVGVLIFGLGFATLTVARARPLPGLLDPTHGLRRVLESEVRPLLERERPPRILVLARPPVSFYLGGRLPLVSVGDLKALAAARRPGDWLLIDDATLNSDEQRRGIETSQVGDGPVQLVSFWSANPTRLDEDAELPFGRDWLPDVLYLIRAESSP